MKTKRCEACDKPEIYCDCLGPATKIEHTATPWKISTLRNSIEGTDFDGATIRLFDIPDHESEYQQTDAKFLVKAVNNYELLMKENVSLMIQREKLLEAAIKAKAYLVETNAYNHGNVYVGNLVEKLHVVIAQTKKKTI